MQQFPALLETPRLTAIEHVQHHEPVGHKSYHQHQDTEIFFVEEGKGEFIVGNRPFPVSGGELILINPGTEHETASSIEPRLKGFLLTFHNFSLSELPPGFLTPAGDSPVLNVKEHHFTIIRYLEDLHQEYRECSPGSEEIISSLLTAVVLKIIRFKYAAKESQSTSLSERVKRYIEQNYPIDLSLNDLANHIYISPYHLSHTFKNDVGISPIQYLIQYRIEVSKKLLMTSNLAISEIAYKVGYPNPNYFNLIFKKLTGVSPGKFRKQ
jgi:AraC-like DNA-binding protein